MPQLLGEAAEELEDRAAGSSNVAPRLRAVVLPRLDCLREEGLDAGAGARFDLKPLHGVAVLGREGRGSVFAERPVDVGLVLERRRSSDQPPGGWCVTSRTLQVLSARCDQLGPRRGGGRMFDLQALPHLLRELLVVRHLLHQGPEFRTQARPWLCRPPQRFRSMTQRSLSFCDTVEYSRPPRTRT